MSGTEISVKDACGVMEHIKRKAESICTSNSGAEEKVYSDIYRQALRESGAYSVESILRKYLSAVHSAIDAYTLPKIMEAEIIQAMEKEDAEDAKDDSSDGDTELG